MFRTFDMLNGDATGEETAEAMEAIAEASSELDLAALVARFNDIDARINKIEGKLNDAFKSQATATQDAVEASNDIADEDNGGEAEEPPADEPDKSGEQE